MDKDISTWDFTDVLLALVLIPMALIMAAAPFLIVFQDEIASKVAPSTDEFHGYTVTEKMSITKGSGHHTRTSTYFRVTDDNGTERLLKLSPLDADSLYLTYQEGDTVTVCFRTITPMLGEPYTLYLVDDCSVDFVEGTV